MKLLRIGVANFRSIGAQSVMIDLQKRINLLIGANNSGKSNVLEIVQRLGAGNNRFTNITLENIDLHRRTALPAMQITFEVAANTEDRVPPGVRRFRFDV